MNVLCILLFNLFWYLTAKAVLAETSWLSAILFFLFVALSFRWRPPVSAAKTLGLALVGMLFDWVLLKSGAISFFASPPVMGWDFNFFLPLWLISLWLMFAWVAAFLARQFQSRPLALIIGCLAFGPLSYFAGQTMGLLQVTNIWIWLLEVLFWGLYAHFGLIRFLEAKA